MTATAHVWRAQNLSAYVLDQIVQKYGTFLCCDFDVLGAGLTFSLLSATKFSCVNEKALCPPEGSAWCSLVCQIPKHTKGGFTCTKIKICQFWCPSARARSPKLVPVIFIIWEPGIDCNLIGAYLTRNTASLHCETATSYTFAKVFQEHVSQLAGFLKYYGRFLHGAEIRITWVADSRVFDLIMWTKRK